MDIALFVELHLTQISLPPVLTAVYKKVAPFTYKMAEDGETLQAQYLI
jgi:hypothetical protein